VKALVAELRRVVGARGLVLDPAERRTYESDGLKGYAVVPGLVVLPESAEQVQEVVRACCARGVPFVARGAGTGLSGGALPLEDGVLIALSRMRRILEIDTRNRLAVVEPGVSNLAVTEAAAPHGLYYAPDPSSQVVCSIGGNVAENSGGAHCLKYGFTTHHVLGLEVVLPDGERVALGAMGVPEAAGYDLMGAFVGSEGTLGIVTKIALRLTRRPEAVRTLLASFGSTDAAGAAVSDVIAAGIVPAAAEMMDALSIQAAEAAVAAGYPAGAGAVLIVELDGPAAEVLEELAAVEAICRRRGATELRLAATDAERALMWKGRKSAFAAMGRISVSYYVQDGVIPRSALSEVLARIAALAAERGLRVANVFHAGDGNLHPLVLYDPGVPGQEAAAGELASEILGICLDHGGSITGEHGVGVDKKDAMPRMFAPPDLEAMHRLRCAFDPQGLCNPGKLFPTPRLCGERPGPHKPHPLVEAGVADLF
jgi:glycolate oxidase